MQKEKNIGGKINEEKRLCKTQKQKKMKHSFVAYSKLVQDIQHVYGPKYITWRNSPLHLKAALQYCTEPWHEESLPLEWYNKVFPRLTKLTKVLKNLDLVDGNLVDINENSTVNDEHLLHKMHHFKALVRAFVGHPSIQEELMKNVSAAMEGRRCSPPLCFTKPIEREPMMVNNLTKVCNFLNISAQQRKTVRFTICPQVAQHRIFTGALEEVLAGLKTEMKLSDSHGCSKGKFMGQQIVSTCLKFLAETANRRDEVASSWMRPKPSKVAVSQSSRKWEEVLEMFNDLIKHLRLEEGLSFHVSKLEVMKEGLTQIKDVLIDRDIGYREVQHHESLVQKKLLKTLGHSSRCLFTLLRYYLHQSVRDMEVEVCGGLYEIGEKNKLCLCMGKILTSEEERMIWNGIKQLDRALGLFKFVWETSGMKRRLELQGHLWCIGADSRIVTYKGNLFFLHGITI
ncbi:50S ribosomal protein L3 chloroplastic [Bienertia sinuspersici]